MFDPVVKMWAGWLSRWTHTGDKLALFDLSTFFYPFCELEYGGIVDKLEKLEKKFKFKDKD